MLLFSLFALLFERVIYLVFARPLLPAVPRLQFPVDTLAPGPLRQQPEQRLDDGEEAWHPSLAPLEQESRVVEVLRQPFGVRVAVRSEAVSYPERFLETAVARPEFDQESSRPAGGVVEVVQRVLRRDGLLSRGQGAGFAADHHLQRTRDHLEVLGVRQVVVRRRPPAGGDLDLDEGVLATRLLARLQEGGAVLLDRVVDPQLVLLRSHSVCSFSHEFRSPLSDGLALRTFAIRSSRDLFPYPFSLSSFLVSGLRPRSSDRIQSVCFFGLRQDVFRVNGRVFSSASASFDLLRALHG